MAFKDRLYDLPVVGTAMRVQDRHKADAGDQFAAAIGFFGFLSLFPIIVLALSITGFVLADRPAGDAAAVADAITDAIPGFGAVLGDCPPGDTDCATGIAQALDQVVDNRGSIGLVGLISLLLTGLRVTNAAQTATLMIFDIDLLALKGWRLKVRQLVVMAAVGTLALLGAASSSVVGYFAGLDPTGAASFLAPAAGVAATFFIDFTMFLAAYGLLLMAERPPWRTLVPGAALAAIGWTALKIFGSVYVSGQVADASELYGALGGVIGLLLLFYLAGRLFVYGAELSAYRLGGDNDVPPTVPDDTAPEEWRSEDVAADDVAPDEVPSAGKEGAARTHELTAAMRAVRAGRSLPPPSADPSMAVRAGRPAAPPDGGPRHATAFALAVAAVGGLVAALKPWRRE